MVSEKLGAAFIEVGVDTGKLTTGLAGAKAQVTGFGASASSAFSGLVSSINPATIAIAGATAAVAALGAGIVSSVGAAADFQQSMANVAAVAGGGAEELKALSDAAREAGAGTVFSATEAAEAQYYLASAGMATEEIIASLNDTLLLAGAGGLSMGRSAEIVTNSLSQFNMEASESGRVANVLAAAASGSNTTVSQMGIGMAKVGPIANALGMSFEQTSASLMVLANAGIKGEEGGTMLRGVLSSLMDVSDKAAEALAEMGLSAEDIDPALNSVDEIFEKLNASGMTASQAVKIFGREASSAAINLAAGADDIKSFEEAITGTSKAQEMYNTQTETFNGAMKMLGSAVEEAKISLGNVFLPVLTDAVKWLTEGVTAATNFGKSIYEMYGKVAAAEEKLGAFGVGEMVGYALNPTDALGGAFGWAKGKLGFETGKEIGEDLTEGVAEGTEGVGPAIEENLESVDAKGAGETVGKSFTDAFNEYVGKGISKELAGPMAAFGFSDTEALNWINQKSRRSGKDWASSLFNIEGHEYELMWDTSGNRSDFSLYVDGVKAITYDSVKVHPHIEDMFATAGFDAPEKGSADWHNMVAAYLDSVDDAIASVELYGGLTAEEHRAEAIKIQMKAEVEIEPILDPYTTWGSPQHMASKMAGYTDEISDSLLANVYAMENNLREEGKAGWEQAWADILDPTSTNAQIEAALDILQLDEYGIELVERIREGFEGLDLTDSIVDAGKYQEYKLEELGATWGKALGDGMVSVQEKETLLGIVDALELAGYEGADALRQAILDEDWEGLGALIGGLTGDGFTAALNALGGPALLDGIFRLAGGELKEYTLADLLNMSQEERDLIVADEKAWGKNVLLPTIDETIGEMNDKWDEGYALNRQIVEIGLWNIIDAYHDFGEAFSAEQAKLISDLEAGTIGAEKFLDAWLVLGQGAVESANLLNGAMKTAEAACSECQEAMSEFGIWQEENADRLFSRSFIGPTDDYQKFLAEERARGAIHPEPIQMSMVYKAETAEADAALEELKESASETQYMPIEIDDAAAYNAIRSINAAAAEPIIKPVYIVPYGGYGGYGGSNSDYLEGLSPGITSSPDWGTPDWLPHLATGGIPTRPITAVVGDVPEAIIPLDRISPMIQQAVAAAGYGGGTVINSTINVYGGTVMDENELYSVLGTRDEQLKHDIAEKFKFGR